MANRSRRKRLARAGRRATRRANRKTRQEAKATLRQQRIRDESLVASSPGQRPLRAPRSLREAQRAFQRMEGTKQAPSAGANALPSTPFGTPQTPTPSAAALPSEPFTTAPQSPVPMPPSPAPQTPVSVNPPTFAGLEVPESGKAVPDWLMARAKPTPSAFQLGIQEILNQKAKGPPPEAAPNQPPHAASEDTFISRPLERAPTLPPQPSVVEREARAAPQASTLEREARGTDRSSEVLREILSVLREQKALLEQIARTIENVGGVGP